MTLLGAALALGLLAFVPSSANAAASAPEGSFTSLVPTRILDTRDGTGQPAARAVPGGDDIVVQIGGVAGVPVDAAVVVLNLTATRASAGGHVTAFPAGAAMPETSNLNFAAGDTIANQVTVRLGFDGRVALANGSRGTVHLVADVVGWYAGGPTNRDGSFTPMPSKRVYDSRQHATIPAYGTVDVKVERHLGLVEGQIARPVLLNVTVTGAGADGHIRAWPREPLFLPNTSIMNFSAGRTIANAAMVAPGAFGDITFENGSSEPIHLIVDVYGWFRPGAAETAGGFEGPARGRLLDTRTDARPVPAGGSVEVQVANANNPAHRMAAAVLTVAAVRPAAGGHITAYPTGGALPLASHLNFSPGRTIANLVTVRVAPSGRVTLHNGSSSPVHLVVDLRGSFTLSGHSSDFSKASKPEGSDANVVDTTATSQQVLYTATTEGTTSLYIDRGRQGASELVSVPLAGEPAETIDVREGTGSISDDGRFAVFESVTPWPGGAEPENRQVLLRDLVQGTTVGLGTSIDGPPRAAGGPVVSGDGSVVVYEDRIGLSGLAVYRTQLRRSDFFRPGPGIVRAHAPSLSADGRWLAFAAETESGSSGVFVHEFATGVSTLVSDPGATGVLATHIDAVGDTVAWSESVPGAEGTYRAYVRDWRSGAAAEQVSEGVQLSGSEVFPTSISSDGLRVGLYVIDPDQGRVVHVLDRPSRTSILVPRSGGGGAVLDLSGGRVTFTVAPDPSDPDDDGHSDVHTTRVGAPLEY